MPFAKLIASAAANATNNHKADEKKLVVKSVSVTKGPTLKRGRAVSKGSTHKINKRTSILKVELAVK